jgi:hypothetical protein
VPQFNLPREFISHSKKNQVTKYVIVRKWPALSSLILSTRNGIPIAEFFCLTFSAGSGHIVARELTPLSSEFEERFELLKQAGEDIKGNSVRELEIS